MTAENKVVPLHRKLQNIFVMGEKIACLLPGGHNFYPGQQD